MKNFISSLNRLYKLDSSIISLMKKLACLEKFRRNDSLEYKRYLNYLDLVTEEERNHLKEMSDNDDYLNLILFLHMQNVIRNSTPMLLAMNEPYENLGVNRIYNLILELIIQKHSSGDNISFEYAIEDSLKMDLYLEFLRKIDLPELTYKLSYIYPLLEEKLVFNGFNLKESVTPDILIQFYSEQKEFSKIRTKVYTNEFLQTFNFLIVGNNGIDNFYLGFQVPFFEVFYTMNL